MKSPPSRRTPASAPVLKGPKALTSSDIYLSMDDRFLYVAARTRDLHHRYEVSDLRSSLAKVIGDPPEEFYREDINGWIAKLDAGKDGGIAFDPKFLVQWPHSRRQHQIRLEGRRLLLGFLLLPLRLTADG